MELCDAKLATLGQLTVKNTFLGFVCKASLGSQTRCGSTPPALETAYRHGDARAAQQADDLSAASTDHGTGTESESSLGLGADLPSRDSPVHEHRTTVMLRNLPNNYTRDMLLEHIENKGFIGLIDFFYLPIDFRSHACLGYAFVNLPRPT